MNNFNKSTSNYIFSLHRYSKRVIAITTDISLCILCTWFAYVLRLEELIYYKDFNLYPVAVSIIIAVPVFGHSDYTELFSVIPVFQLFLQYWPQLLFIHYYIFW